MRVQGAREKTVSRKKWYGKVTSQKGFATLTTREHSKGRFTFRVGDVRIEAPGRLARRLFHFLKHHYDE